MEVPHIDWKLCFNHSKYYLRQILCLPQSVKSMLNYFRHVRRPDFIGNRCKPWMSSVFDMEHQDQHVYQMY